MKWRQWSHQKTYSVFLFSILFCLIIKEIVIQYHLTQQKTEAKIINLIGRQRMLSQRVSKLVILLSIKDNQKLPSNNYNLLTLQQLTQEWTSAYQYIYNYSKTHADKRILAFYKENSVYKQSIIKACNDYLANPSPQYLPKLIKLTAENELKFLFSMENIVLIYQKNAEAKLNQLKIIEFSLFGFIVILFLSELIFVVSPVVLNIVKKNNDLKLLNDELLASEEEFRKANDTLHKLREELEAQEKINRIFIEQAPNAIAMFDNHLNYLAASDKWMQDYQLIEKEIIGKSHYEIFPEIGDNWKKIHQECLKGAFNICKEAEFPRANGTSQWLAWDVRPWYKSDKEIGGLLMLTEDITLLKQKDTEKNKIEEILNKTSEVARIGTWELDLINNKIYWSKVTKEIHEVDQDYIPESESAINFYVEGESRNKIQLLINEAKVNGIPYDVEVQLQTFKGNLIWTRSIGQAKFVNGKCVGLYGVFQDINNIKTTEIALNSVNEELKAIFDASPIAIISTTANGIITHFNKGAETMLQYNAADVIDKLTPVVMHKEAEILDRQKELSAYYQKDISGFDVFVAAAKNDLIETRQWTYVKKDGTEFPIELVVTPIKDIENNITGFIGLATDISVRIENESKILEANNNLEGLTKKLSSQNNQLASFAHITSHNLRSPVGNLNALLNFYKSAEDDAEKEMLMEKFETVINHLSGTLNTLIDALKIKEDSDQILVKLSFKDVFNKTIEILIGQIMEVNASIKCDFSKAEEIPYSQTYLESIFLNLITNALKYKAKNKTPEIFVETFTLDGKIVLKVSDNGLGIDLTRHGDKLFGLNKTFHRHAEAKGVGLYLTKTQIEVMGGKIYAQSKVNKGTTFIIEF